MVLLPIHRKSGEAIGYKDNVSKKITTNLTKPYFISTTFWTCFFSLFSNFNDEKIKVHVLQ